MDQRLPGSPFRCLGRLDDRQVLGTLEREGALVEGVCEGDKLHQDDPRGIGKKTPVNKRQGCPISIFLSPFPIVCYWIIEG